MIELKNLTCSYEDKHILQNINLNIKDSISIMGANGSGKSTLAKAICNLVKFDGEVKLNSQDIKQLSLKDRAKTICYIPAKLQNYDSFITVEEFVLQARFSYKKSFFQYSSEDRNIARESIEFLNIAHLKNHTLSSLSSGEQQLTLIAEALTGQSDIIIFDEPTANLDPANSKIIAKHIKELTTKHQVILITHDLSISSYFQKPVLFLKDSKTKLYNKEFFDTKTLEELYGVEFESLAVKYE